MAKCQFCGADYWLAELTTTGKFNLCCSQGKVHRIVPELMDHPKELEELLTGESAEAKLFLENAITYNNRFQRSANYVNIESFSFIKIVNSLL